MKHPIVAARARSQPTVSGLHAECTASDSERLLDRGMVPGAIINDGVYTVLLFAVNIHGHVGLPSALFAGVQPALIRSASLVLVCGAGSTSRLATIMTAGLLSGFWRLVQKSSSA